MGKKCFDETGSGPIVGASFQFVLVHSVTRSAKSFAALLATFDYNRYFGLRSFVAGAFGFQATAQDLLANSNFLHFGQGRSTKDLFADFVGRQGSVGRVVVVDFGFMKAVVPKCSEVPRQVWPDSE